MMNAVWDVVLSPYGLALYVGFWILKLMFGAWVLRKAMTFLPVRAQDWTEDKLSRLKLKRRARRL